jgi:Na+-driven multidrug efflux pump
LLKLYNFEIYSIGIGYSINFIFMMGFLHIYFKKYEKNKLLKNGFSINKLSFNILITLLKFGAVPMINYFLFLISIESISFYGFMINDESFTIMTIFMNILSVIVVISEAVACSMSSLISYSISNNKNHIVYKIFRSGLFLSALIQILFLGILNIFPDDILSIFFDDHKLIQLANKEIYLFSIGISMNSFHFILCEYIIVNGNHSIPLYSLLFGKLIIQNLLAYFLTSLLGLSGIILSMNIGEFVCIVIFIIYINFYMKTNKCLIDDSVVYVINK